MNIYEFCEEYRISMQKARKMDEAGVLRLDSGESEHGAEIRRQLRSGQPLTVAHFIQLIENPSILCELGRYREKAERELAALGDVRKRAAPRDVAAYIAGAARRDKEAVGVLVAWLKAVIGAEPLMHQDVAVFLLMGLPASIRHFDVLRIRHALLNCRKSSDFRGWWRVEKRRSRSVTFYQRPGDIFDL